MSLSGVGDVPCEGQRTLTSSLSPKSDNLGGFSVEKGTK